MTPRRVLSIAALAVLAACSRSEPPAPASTEQQTAGADTAPVDVPAGEYKLDPTHASLLFRVDHLGFSNYTARFRKFDATLQFDPANLAASTLFVNIDPRSLETDYPEPEKIDFNAKLLGEEWLNVAQFPELTYRSTSVEVTGPRTMKITGDLTLHGVTKPVSLEATFNGGWAGHPFDPNARIGFSARGELKRSDFGVSYGIPEPGSNMGVSDRVEIIVETEFSGPPLQVDATPEGTE